MEDWKENKSLQVLSAVKAVISVNKKTAFDLTDFSASMKVISHTENILAWQLIDPLSQTTIAQNHNAVVVPESEYAAAFTSWFQAQEHFDVQWNSKALTFPYHIQARIDAKGLQAATVAYIIRIGGLVIIISLSVTTAVMVALRIIIFSPILTLRTHLNSAKNDLQKADDYLIDIKTNGEIGELYLGFNALLLHIMDSFRKIKKSNSSLEKEIQDKKKIENELLENKKILEEQASHDDLTGLPNRRIALAKLSYEIQYSIENETFGALLFIDLDNFKEINDTLGHSSGDELLIQVSSAMVSAMRNSGNSVNKKSATLLTTGIEEKRRSSHHNKNDLVARVGGDEFMVILCDISVNEVKSTVERIQASFKTPFSLSGGEAFSTPSIGISIFPEDSKIPSECMSFADIALYEAKEAGKNRYRFFSPDMIQGHHYRSQIIQQLHYALNNEEFSLYFQPIINLESEKIVSVEALLRWENVELGTVAPDRFIPIAESCGLISPIGEWVLETAFQKCQQLNMSKDAIQNTIRIAINISPKQFKNKNIFTLIEDLLRKYQLSPSLIDFEITESLLLEKNSEAGRNIKKLSQLGINFSIDDFGTGYSSLQYLSRFSVNTLKIDRSFINDIVNNKGGAPLVKTIIDMGKNFKLNIIAEGVETKEQRDFLKSNDCDLAQGYYFNKPMPFDELLEKCKVLK